MNNYTVVNICDLMGDSAHTPDEEGLQKMLSEFSCPLNKDVEHFLKYEAIEFAKKSQSITYLVCPEDRPDILGYFTLAIQSLTVNASSIPSNNIKKKIQRASRYVEEDDSYTMAAYLIAQLGKNYANNANEEISGSELLQLAINQIRELQHAVGGLVVFLEAENNEELLSFYKRNKFKIFDVRQSKSSLTKPHELIKLMMLIPKK